MRVQVPPRAPVPSRLMARRLVLAQAIEVRVLGGQHCRFSSSGESARLVSGGWPVRARQAAPSLTSSAGPERRHGKAKVIGSNPMSGSRDDVAIPSPRTPVPGMRCAGTGAPSERKNKYPACRCGATVAYYLAKVGVAGSNPVICSVPAGVTPRPGNPMREW